MDNFQTHTALDVANAFLELAKRDGRTLTNMELQKHVYIAFGYYAGFLNERLFTDDIQAWSYGPVIPNLYHELKRYGVGPVTEPLAGKNPIPARSPEMNIIESVWDSYRKFSAIQLSMLTHKDGTPWSHMMEKAKGKKNVTIPFSLIREHYDRLIRERKNG